MVTRRAVLMLGAAAAAAWRAPAALASAAPMDATALAALIRRGEISALEAVEQAIARIERMNPQLNFMVTKAYDRARERARRADLAGPFAGVPFLVKDLTDVTGLPTRSGSRSTRTEPAKTNQSAYVTALEQAGLIIVGKSSTPEYGGSATTEPLAFEPTRNPWNLRHSAGGSSGGSAAAVAAGVVPIAHANDGGGSIRIPASNCGLVGLKPSRGRTISAGAPPAARIALASDHCVSHSVRDTAMLLAATEDRSANARFAPIGLVTTPGRRRLRIALVSINQSGIEPDADVKEGLVSTSKLLADMGHTVIPAKWPFPVPQFSDDFREYWITAAARIVRAFADAHGRDPGPEDFEPVFLDMARSAMPPGEQFEALLARLHQHAKAYEDAFKSFDVILSPVLNRPPAPLGYLHGTLSWSQMKERIGEYTGYTPIQNVAGAPAISLPLHWSRAGLPIGMHFAGRSGDERTLLELAFEIEEARPWHDRVPPNFIAAAAS